MKIDPMTEYEKMLNGEIFDDSDTEITSARANALQLMVKINHCDEFGQSQQLIRQLFKKIGETSVVKPPFHCEFGKQISIGEKSFINMGVTMLDGANITIGNNVMVGPSTQFYTASHSMNHLERREWEAFCKPINIEDDVWIGGNVVINQGVTIGARSIVAANSVINQDVPSDCVVGGTPARVLKKLS